MLKITLMTAILAAQFTPVFAEGETRDKAVLQSLFLKMEGNWSCSGENSKGDATGATVDISLSVDGRYLTYNHKNTVRNSNEMRGIWVYDTPLDNLLVTRSYLAPDAVYSDSLLGVSWTGDKLIVRAKEVWQPLFAEHRFVYEFPKENTFKVTWERVVEKGTEKFEMGDYLICEK